MASSNKPTMVHFSLIFTLMATLILGVFTVLGYKGKGEAERALADATNKEGEANRALATQVNDMQDAIRTLGAGGSTYPEAKNATLEAMQRLGVNQEQQTVLASLQALRSALDVANAENATLKADTQSLRTELQKVQSDYENRVTQAMTSQQTSEALVQATQADKDEQVQQRDREISRINEELRNEKVERAQVQDRADQMEAELNRQIANLTNIVNTQRQRLDELVKVSFDVADGEIVSVDANLNIVYINLGELDNLRPQVSFSVYDRNHHGVGREARDIKGRIEVTRLLGGHLAEARILEKDRARPITDGDPIYSPIFASGRQELFSFVGAVDFDNDGISDRETLRRVLRTAGADIEVEVNDEGVREPADGKVTIESKFLILGKVPDPTSFASGDERRLQAERTMTERNAMLSEALQSGVRVIQLSDFLAYIGYKPQSRFFVPGQVDNFTLQQGARSPSERDDDTTGKTSDLFQRMRRERDTGIRQFRN